MTVLASWVVLIVTAGLLFYIAFTDLRQFKIRNEFVAALAALFFVHTGLSGRWTTMHWNLAFAAVMLVLMLPWYVKNWIGGGDVKLMTVAFLWTGLNCLLPFLVFLLVFASLHAIAVRLSWVYSMKSEGKHRVAFAPSIAAGLIGTFMLGCLAPI